MARLGELERAVMEVLWAVPGPLTAREVVDALSARSPAHTTVLTVLSRLEKKALVRRTRVTGRAYAYRPVASREDHTAELMRAALDAAGDRVAALARFVGSVSPQEAEVLRRALESVGPPPAGTQPEGAETSRTA